MSSHTRPHVDQCLNCGAATPGAYCSACGQEAVGGAVTFRDHVAHFFEEVFTVESRLPQTLRLLLTRPGELTRAYNAGARVRYVTPLKLYLFASVAFFLVLSFAAPKAASPRFERVHNPKPEGMHVVLGGAPWPSSAPSSSSSSSSAPSPGSGASPPAQTAPNSWTDAETFDEWLKKPENAGAMPAFIQPHVRALLKSPEGFMGGLVDLLSKASMVLVPIHALLLKLAYLRSRRFYGEHIVFSLHLHAFAYLAFAIAMGGLVRAPDSVASGAESVVMIAGAVYASLAARRAYGEGLARSAIKMSAVGVGYVLALFAVVTLAASAAFFMA
jgi:hypothetical protein